MILLSGGELCKEKLSKECQNAIHTWYTNKNTLSEVTHFKSDKWQFFLHSSVIPWKKKFAFLMYMKYTRHFYEAWEIEQ